MTHSAETVKHNSGEDQTLSLYFPELVITQEQHFLCDVHDALRVVLGYGVQDAQTVNSNVDLGGGEADQSIIKEHVKPLFIELLLLCY